MKLYKQQEPPLLMRINIKKQGVKTEHISIEETTQQELYDWLKKLIDAQGLSIFATGRITTVEIRESVNGVNGKSVSFSFKGLEPIQVNELILKNIPQKA